MNEILRKTLALNIVRRAAQIAAADPDWLAEHLFPARLVELDYELESAGMAMDDPEGAS